MKKAFLLAICGQNAFRIAETDCHKKTSMVLVRLDVNQDRSRHKVAVFMP